MFSAEPFRAKSVKQRRLSQEARRVGVSIKHISRVADTSTRMVQDYLDGRRFSSKNLDIAERIEEALIVATDPSLPQIIIDQVPVTNEGQADCHGPMGIIIKWGRRCEVFMLYKLIRREYLEE